MRVRKGVVCAAVLGSSLLTSTADAAIDIVFNYSKDTRGFFNDPARRARLDQAAAYFETFTDTLSAINPSPPTLTWSAVIVNPPDANTAFISNLVVPANTIVVFPGGGDLIAGHPGSGGPGFTSDITSNQAWYDTITTRGQPNTTSVPPSDYSTWGGSIRFDDVGVNWWFGDTITGIAPDQTDFLSVAIREIAHVLGFGRAGSFTRWATFSSYVGPHVTALRGPSGAPLDTTTHEDWAEGTTSSIGGVGSFEAAMDPTLAPGQRKLLTDLDYAALADVGWEVGPIPDATALSLVPLLAIPLLRRARR